MTFECDFCGHEQPKHGECPNCSDKHASVWLQRKQQKRGVKPSVPSDTENVSFRLWLTPEDAEAMQEMTPKARVEYLKGIKPKKPRKKQVRNRLSVTIDPELEQILDSRTNDFSKAEYAAFLMKMEGRRIERNRTELLTQLAAIQEHEERLKDGQKI